MIIKWNFGPPNGPKFKGTFLPGKLGKKVLKKGPLKFVFGSNKTSIRPLKGLS